MSLELASSNWDRFLFKENEDCAEISCDISLASHFFNELKVDADEGELSHTLRRRLI